MEVKNARCTFLTNQEVLVLLKEANQAVRPKNESLQQHKTVLYESIKYLEATPAAQQSEANVRALMKEMQKFKMTPAELLQVVNLRPRNLVDIEMILEECDERYTEEQTAEMLDLIKRHLPEAPVKTEVVETPPAK
ncbi:hypothetical protein M3Y99_01826600 [Aphelenchoides fujianensis]|nr:hypothetical protein M3Y99_01826600 [Aphelenchoides fujianensis]